MNAITKYFIAAVGAALLSGGAISAQPSAPPKSDDTRAYFEVLRSDFNSTKVRTLNEVLKLTAVEADKFWPIYRRYEKDLAAVGDRKLALIRKFISHHKGGTLDDQNSKTIATQWLENAQDRLDLWKKYYREISAALSPMRAAQFLQVEHQLALFVDIEIASEMPAVQPGKSGE
ncbi:MAG: hypothetical protein AB9869_09420 [Verrucomicrobiia bacterium]